MDILTPALITKLIEYAPAVFVLIYLNVRLERRISRLEDTLLALLRDCLASIEGDHHANSDPP